MVLVHWTCQNNRQQAQQRGTTTLTSIMSTTFVPNQKALVVKNVDISGR